MTRLAASYPRDHQAPIARRDRRPSVCVLIHHSAAKQLIAIITHFHKSLLSCDLVLAIANPLQVPSVPVFPLCLAREIRELWEMRIELMISSISFIKLLTNRSVDFMVALLLLVAL